MADSLLSRLMEEYIAAIRCGNVPDPEDYAARYPHLAVRIRELFPTLMMLENAAGIPNSPTVRIPGFSTGTIFGPYRILREIGRGGMGIVYEAVQIRTQKHVALKILPLQAPFDPKRVERFFREARITADLEHPNIIPVLDVGQVTVTAYFAMRYIEGTGLDRIFRLMQSGKLPREETTFNTGSDEFKVLPDMLEVAGGIDPVSDAACRIRAGVPALFEDYLRWTADLGIQAASGLAYAHSHRLIHRDIKPSNLILDRKGNLWIADFGLARNMEDPALTSTGVLLGTPRYMSPEQAEAARRQVDHRSDIYSLGATFYELVTRRPVFDGNTPQEVLLQILVREPAAPRRLNPQIPADLEAIVMKAMAKRPEDRYQSADALADDLKRWTRKEPIKAKRSKPVHSPLQWIRKRSKFAAVIIPLALALIVLGVLYYRGKYRDILPTQVADEFPEQDRDRLNSVAKDRDRDRFEKTGPSRSSDGAFSSNTEIQPNTVAGQSQDPESQIAENPHKLSDDSRIESEESVSQRVVPGSDGIPYRVSLTPGSIRKEDPDRIPQGTPNSDRISYIRGSPEPQRVLNLLEKVYEDFHSFRADILTKKYVALLEEFDPSESGRFYFFRGANDAVYLRIEILEPAERYITVKDGIVTVYKPADKAATVSNKIGTLYPYLPPFISEPPERLQKDFEITSPGSGILDRTPCKIFQFKPIKPDVFPGISTITAWINESGGAPLQCRFEEPFGDYSLITFDRLELRPNESLSIFDQKLPRDVSVRYLDGESDGTNYTARYRSNRGLDSAITASGTTGNRSQAATSNGPIPIVNQRAPSGAVSNPSSSREYPRISSSSGSGAIPPGSRLRIRIGTMAPKGTPWHDVLLDIKQEWEKISGGKLQIQIFAGSVLGDETKMVEKMKSGSIQGVALSTIGLSRIDNSANCLQIPMLFKSYEELDYVRERIAPVLEKKLEEKGVKLLHWADAGWVRTFSKEPSFTPNDLRKMRLFTNAGDPVTENLYRDFGYQVYPGAGDELLSSLRIGAVSAVNNVPLLMLTLNANEDAPYMTNIQWLPLAAGTVIDLKTWNHIPSKYHDELLKAAGKAGNDHRDRIRKQGEDSIPEMQKRGLKIVELDEATRALWQKEAENTYPYLRGRYAPAELFDEVLRLHDEYRRSHFTE
jgi:serine/threonine protein kinase/TRAP-type C4-dicarboxylate transport system substrate-binding protein